jgi:hypothetical protein
MIFMMLSIDDIVVPEFVPVMGPYGDQSCNRRNLDDYAATRLPVDCTGTTGFSQTTRNMQPFSDDSS